MDAFQAIPNRDACYTIAGFLYQFDLTILRWLELASGQVLELERGEDIDTVARGVLGEPGSRPDWNRLLEQVKHRSDKLTLRHPTALASIASFIEHRRSNPDQQVFFRYLTTASAGRERGVSFPRGLRGTEAWEELRTGNLQGDDASHALEAIRSLLRNARRPTGVSADQWEAFRQFWTEGADGDLRELIQRFEWATASEAPEALRDRIIHYLIEEKGASGQAEARELYARLLVHVLECLRRPGLKQLTPPDLDAQFVKPTLSDRDRERLEALTEFVDAMERRISALEDGQRKLEVRQDVVENAQSQLEVVLSQVIGGSGASIRLADKPRSPVLDVPPLLAQRSSRSKVVDGLSDLLKEHDWLALSGGVGYGKTQVVRLVAERRGGPVAWVRLRDDTAADAAARLDAVLAHLGATDAGTGRLASYPIGMAALGGGGLLVVDDLPPMISGDQLHECAVALARASASTGVRLVTTSHAALPAGTGEYAPECNLLEVPVPPFNTEETLELLGAHGAPASLCTESFAQFLTTITSGHPVLLAAMIRYLATMDWRLSDEELAGLLAGKAADAIANETVRRLLATVSDRDSRRLLWRLSVAVGEFTEDDVRLLATLDPIVDSPITAITAPHREGAARGRGWGAGRRRTHIAAL